MLKAALKVFISPAISASSFPNSASMAVVNMPFNKNVTDNVVRDYSSYENNGSMNMAFVQAAKTVPEDIKKRIESINKIENKKDII